MKGMRFSRSKEAKLNITVWGHILDQVKQFTYLGCILKENGLKQKDSQRTVSLAKIDFYKGKRTHGQYP